MNRLVIATHNQGKIREIKGLLHGISVEVLSINDFQAVPSLPETGETFEENAVSKAHAVADLTGLPALADDSGLEVDALDGRPGVYSARYSGPDATDIKNIEKLLIEMKNVEEEKRTARFVCVAALVIPEGETRIFRGECEGLITKEPRGANGFGYDPVFYYPSFGCTFGEADPESKNRISHRAKAFEKLKESIEVL